LEYSEKTRIKRLLMEFAHVFYNDEKPEYFREGLRVPPIEIYVTDEQPMKDKQRRVNDTKAPYLRKHIEKMEKEGTISIANQHYNEMWISNPHIVLEECWEAATKQLKSKSRMCIDYSPTLNKKIKKCTYPIPLMDEFRRKVASFKCFTNLDTAKFYSQLRISERSKKYTGFCACGDLWFYNKTPMGIIPATNYCRLPISVFR
jgi:hypothetical protein